MDNKNTVLTKIDKVITKINEVILAVVLFLMFAFTFSNVVGRYFFQTSIAWASEAARFLMMSLAFLGMGLAMRQGRHSSFNVFQDALPQKVRKLVRIFVAALIIAFMIILLVLGFQYMMRFMWNPTEVMRWPSGVWYSAIPLGCLMFLFHFGMMIKDYVNKPKDADIEKALDKETDALNAMQEEEGDTK